MLVIHIDFFSSNNSVQGSKSFLVTKTVICLPFFNQFFRILQVNALCLSFRLHIRSYSFVLIRTFIMNKTCFCKCSVYDIYRTFYITFLIGIFYSENKIAVFMLRNQIGIKSCSQIAYMHSACRAGCKSCSYFSHFYFPPYPESFYLPMP